jgi:hypothetical protein
MHRIDHSTAVAGLFTEGSPGVTPATVVTDDWLNDVQENIMEVIEYVGITETKGEGSDLLNAILGILAEEASNQSLSNNASNQNVTAALFASASIKSVIIEADVHRKTDSPTEVTAHFTLNLLQKTVAGTWTLIQNYTGDDTGVTFDLNVGGGNAQLRYTTTNIAGANYVGTIRFKMKKFKV